MSKHTLGGRGGKAIADRGDKALGPDEPGAGVTGWRPAGLRGSWLVTCSQELCPGRLGWPAHGHAGGQGWGAEGGFFTAGRAPCHVAHFSVTPESTTPLPAVSRGQESPVPFFPAGLLSDALRAGGPLCTRPLCGTLCGEGSAPGLCCPTRHSVGSHGDRALDVGLVQPKN